MSLEQCYQDWLDALTQGARDNLEGVLVNIIDEPLGALNDAYDLLQIQLSALQAQLNILQARTGSINLVIGELPIPGSCITLDDDMTNLLNSVRSDLDTQAVKMQGRIAAVNGDSAIIQSQINTRISNTTDAENLKFWE